MYFLVNFLKLSLFNSLYDRILSVSSYPTHSMLGYIDFQQLQATEQTTLR